MTEDLQVVWGAMPYILAGAGTTIVTVACAMLLGLCMGIPMAIGQVYGSQPIRRAVGLYVWVFRGVPILVLLYLIYFSLTYQLQSLEFTLFGHAFHVSVSISPFAASCLVLGLVSAAYQSQIFRGAIQSLSSGQLKAARALGMSDAKAIRSIILPQALRLSIPGWSNEYSILLKDSVLVSVVGTLELMKRVQFIATGTQKFEVFYLIAAALYFIITLLGVRALRLLEHITHIPGFGKA